MTIRPLFFGPVLVGLLFAPRAQAGNGDEVLLGGDATVLGGAVTPVVSDGAALWYNPAGIGADDLNKLDASVSALTLRLARVPVLLRAGPDRTADGDFIDFASVPSAISFIRPIHDQLAVGVGLFVSESRELRFRSTLSVPEPAGQSTWVLDQRVVRSRYHLGAGAGWVASPTVRLGLGVFGVFEQENVTAALFGRFSPSGLGGGADAPVGGLSGARNVSSFGVEARAGLMWTPTPALHIGVCLSSWTFNLAARVSEKRDSVIAGDVSSESRSGFEGRFERTRPPRLRLGAGYAFGPVHLLVLDGDVQARQKEDALGDASDFTWNLRVGARIGVTEYARLGLGLFTDRSLHRTPEGRDSPTLDFYGGTAAIEVRKPYHLANMEDGSEIVFVTTIGLRYAIGTGDVPVTSVDDGTRRVGDMTVHELSLNLASGVYF